MCSRGQGTEITKGYQWSHPTRKDMRHGQSGDTAAAQHQGSCVDAASHLLAPAGRRLVLQLHAGVGASPWRVCIGGLALGGGQPLPALAHQAGSTCEEGLQHGPIS